jgi:hypothetical protein
MTNSLSKRSPEARNLFLPLLILFILADILCDNFLLQKFNNDTGFKSFSILIGFLCLQIVISPLQAGFSDFYCRKKSLIVSLSASLLSLSFIFLYDQKIASYAILLAAIVPDFCHLVRFENLG